MVLTSKDVKGSEGVHDQALTADRVLSRVATKRGRGWTLALAGRVTERLLPLMMPVNRISADCQSRVGIVYG